MTVTDDNVAPASWTFLTNHAHVLLEIAREPNIRQRDIAATVGITIGAVQRIVHELEVEGYIERERIGRRNRYAVVGDKPLRHHLEQKHTVSELVAAVDHLTE